MFCIASFLVLSVMGLWSASHRVLAREAWQCVFRRVTFRPCSTGFREEMKAKITVLLLRRSASLARLFHKYFEAFAWVFVVMTLLSTFFAIRGVVNFYLYGSCQGLNQSGFCVFDPAGEHNKVSTIAGTECRLTPRKESEVTLRGVDLSLFPTLTTSRPNHNSVVFIGCYFCDYTRKTYPMIRALGEKYPFTLTFAHFSVKDPDQFLSEVSYCAAQQDSRKFWSLNDIFFSADKERLLDHDWVMKAAQQSGYSSSTLADCLYASSTVQALLTRRIQLRQTGLYGTPTIFINSQPLVGPKPERVYKRLLGYWW